MRDGADQCPADRQQASTRSPRKKAKEPDTDEPARQHMNQEPTQEFVAVERHCLLLITVGVIFPSERNPTVAEGQQPMA